MAYTDCTREENCILEPIGKTETQTAYKVKEDGVGLGLIFHVHATNTWQCCDGQDYRYPTEAITGLIKLTTKSATVAENKTQETKPKTVTVAEKPEYTKAAAKRIISFATQIEVVREMRNCIQTTYRAHGRRCSTFLSKKLFAADFEQLRHQGAAEIEVVENHGDSCIVKSKDNYYTVRPNHSDPHQRCECGDCHYRGSKCKHQIAVSEYLLKELQVA